MQYFVIMVPAILRPPRFQSITQKIDNLFLK